MEYYLAEIVKQGGIGGKLKPRPVSELPATGESGILYLVRIQGTSGQNMHDEYIWVEDESKYELLGQAKIEIDLPNYALKTELPAKVSELENDSGYLSQHQDISGKVDKIAGKGLSAEDYTTAEKNKLGGIASGAEVNVIDGISVNGNAVTVTNKTAALTMATGVKGDKESAYRTGNVNLTPANIGAVPTSAVGTANGVAELDSSGKVLSSQLPSYVNDVLEYATLSGFPETGERGKIYIAIDTSLTYRWTGTTYAATKTLIDAALSNAGQAADAKATGDALTALEAENALLRELINGIDAPIYRTASGNPVTFEDGYDAANVKALSVTLTPTQSGSGDPYPPGGGKNLWDEQWENGAYNTNGEPTASPNLIRSKNAVPVTPGTNYYLYNGSETNTYVNFYAQDGAFVRYAGDCRGKVFTAPENAYFLEFWCVTAYGNTYKNDICINVSDASFNGQYAPYANVRPISGATSVSVTRTGENGANSQIVTVSFVDSSSNPLTVYGGTLNVTTGELSVTHALLELTSSLNWAKSAGFSAATGYSLFYNSGGITGAKFSGGDANPNHVFMYCSHYPIGNKSYGSLFTAPYSFSMGIGASGGKSSIGVLISSEIANTVDGFKAWLTSQQSAIQVAYPLASPLTYTLTPAQLATVSGYNAVSTDAGTLSVIYRADPALTLGGGT